MARTTRTGRNHKIAPGPGQGRATGVPQPGSTQAAMEERAHPRPGPVIAGFDGTRGGRAAVARAVSIGRRIGAEEIVLVCAQDRPPDFSRHTFLGMPVRDVGWVKEWGDRVQAELAHEVRYVEMAGFAGRAVCALDAPDELLSRVADEADASCIVIYEPRHTLVYEVFFGSIHRLLRRRTAVPIVTVTEEDVDSSLEAA
jgi:hypothetical protein